MDSSAERVMLLVASSTSMALADFSRYLIKLLENNERDELTAAFTMIEQLHVDGDRYVREAATIGILENLQNTSWHEQTGPDQFLEFSGRFR